MTDRPKAYGQRIVLSCLGDSNSASRGARGSWVDMLRSTLSSDSFQIVNRGEGGAFTFHAKDYPNAWSQMEAALVQDRPDLILLAFGTNDLTLLAKMHRGRVGPGVVSTVVKEYLALGKIAAVAGAHMAVGLAPPFRGPRSDARHALVAWLNDDLRRVFPSDLLLDFHEAASHPEDMSDPIHLSPKGHERRAALVQRWIEAHEIDCGGGIRLPRAPKRYPRVGESTGLIKEIFSAQKRWTQSRKLVRLARTVATSKGRRLL